MSTVEVICREDSDEYESFKSNPDYDEDNVYYDWHISDGHLYIQRWNTHGFEQTICVYAPRAWLKVKKHD